MRSEGFRISFFAVAVAGTREAMSLISPRGVWAHPGPLAPDRVCAFCVMAGTPTTKEPLGDVVAVDNVSVIYAFPQLHDMFNFQASLASSASRIKIGGYDIGDLFLQSL